MSQFAPKTIEHTKSFLQSIQSKRARSGALALSAKELEGRKNVLDLNVLVFVDVSGSISEAQFRQFMRQVDAIRGLSRVKVAEIDTRIQAMYDYFKIEISRVMRLGGGGGTEFTPAFALARRLRPDAILFMTDGCVGGAPEDPGIPVGWVLTSGGQKPFSFGEVVRTL